MIMLAATAITGHAGIHAPCLLDDRAAHAFNVAAITAAICTGKESHEEAGKRYIAGLACGVFYVLVGVFGTTLAGLALLADHPADRALIVLAVPPAPTFQNARSPRINPTTRPSIASGPFTTIGA